MSRELYETCESKVKCDGPLFHKCIEPKKYGVQVTEFYCQLQYPLGKLTKDQVSIFLDKSKREMVLVFANVVKIVRTTPENEYCFDSVEVVIRENTLYINYFLVKRDGSQYDKLTIL